MNPGRLIWHPERKLERLRYIEKAEEEGGVYYAVTGKLGCW